jgi:hypothetical protein
MCDDKARLMRFSSSTVGNDSSAPKPPPTAGCPTVVLLAFLVLDRGQTFRFKSSRDMVAGPLKKLQAGMAVATEIDWRQ